MFYSDAFGSYQRNLEPNNLITIVLVNVTPKLLKEKISPSELELKD